MKTSQGSREADHKVPEVEFRLRELWLRELLPDAFVRSRCVGWPMVNSTVLAASISRQQSAAEAAYRHEETNAALPGNHHRRSTTSVTRYDFNTKQERRITPAYGQFSVRLLSPQWRASFLKPSRNRRGRGARATAIWRFTTPISRATKYLHATRARRLAVSASSS